MLVHGAAFSGKDGTFARSLLSPQRKPHDGIHGTRTTGCGRSMKLPRREKKAKRQEPARNSLSVFMTHFWGTVPILNTRSSCAGRKSAVGVDCTLGRRQLTLQRRGATDFLLPDERETHTQRERERERDHAAVPEAGEDRGGHLRGRLQGACNDGTVGTASSKWSAVSN